MHDSHVCVCVRCNVCGCADRSSSAMSDPAAAPPTTDAAMSDAPAQPAAVQAEAVPASAASFAPAASAAAASSSPAPAAPAAAAATSVSVNAGADSRKGNQAPRDKQDPKRRRRDRGDWQPIPAKDKPQASPEDGSGSDDEEGASAGARLGRKRKVALAVMYRGTAYCGLQLQNGPQQTGLTIERVILDAIHAAGGVTAANMDSTQKIKWMRAARTDKGVHAAGNLLSLMMICDGPVPPGCLSSSPNIIDRINAHLPADVRAIAYTRTLGSFHAKYSCSSRVYGQLTHDFHTAVQLIRCAAPRRLARVCSFLCVLCCSSLLSLVRSARPCCAVLCFVRSSLLDAGLRCEPEYIVPSFVFDDSPTMISLLHDPDAAKALAAFNPSTGLPQAPYSYPPALLSYRLTPEKRAEIDSICSLFEGTHNFQNFTRKKSGFLKDAAKSERNDKEKAEKRKRKEKEESEDEGAEGDEAEEEAAERAAFAAAEQEESAAAAAASAASSSSSASSSAPNPSPFTLPKRGGITGVGLHHVPLLVHLKALNTKAGASANTNKQSGQFARFIRFIIRFGIAEVYLHRLPAGTGAAGAAATDTASSSSSSAAAPAAAASAAAPASLEFVRLQIHGQSFMLNQIRKMVGALIIIARHQLDRSYLPEAALAFAEYSVPTAPSLGLLLDRPVYADYDQRLAAGNVRGQKGAAPAAAPGGKKKEKQETAAVGAAAASSPVTAAALTAAAPASAGTGIQPEDRSRIEDLFLGPSSKPIVDAFRSEFIYRAIGDSELSSGSAARWVSSLWAAPAIRQQKRRMVERAQADAEKQKRLEQEQAERNGDSKASEPAADAAMGDAPAAAAASLPEPASQ